MKPTRILDFPAPIYVFDDFLPNRQADEILEDCLALEPFFVPAEVGSREGDRGVVRPDYRHNLVLHLDAHYRNRSAESKILTYLPPAIWAPEQQDVWAGSHLVFSVLSDAARSSLVLSRYGHDDFYGWHLDHSGADRHLMDRIVTCVYYVNAVPERFTGGEIIFREIVPNGEPGNRFATVGLEPKHNRLVAFPSSVAHRVGKVTLAGDRFGDGRFSVNAWFGFPQ